MSRLTLNNGTQAEIVETYIISENLRSHLLQNGWKAESYLVKFERRTRKAVKTYLATARIGVDGKVCLMGAVEA